MTNSGSFGGSQRYYDGYPAPVLSANDAASESISKLLNDYDPELKTRVSRSFRQWNNVLRDQLRNEMGFRLSIGDDTQAIPVRIADGLPLPFRQQIEMIPTDFWRFLLQLPALEKAVDGLDSVIRLYASTETASIPRPLPLLLNPAVQDARMFCLYLLSVLQGIKIDQTLGSINQDILGAYFFRVPEVQLYWMVLGLFSGILGISIESLTIVVAAHELAHAYSHMGRDIDGERWETDAFAQADLDIVEGIAQFYTEIVCKKLEVRNPDVLLAFSKLTAIQQGPYRVHEDWVKQKSGSRATPRAHAGEVVRATMVQCRSRAVTEYAEMKQIMDRFTKGLS